MIFSEKLQILRKNKGLTQEALADKLNVSFSTIGNWEKGKGEPSLSQLRMISELSNIPMDCIVVDNDSF